MSSWKKRIKRKFGRLSGDVSPPATLVDDVPPPFARSLSLRHPGYTSRDGDLRPESFLLLDDQRIPTLRRTWSFRQAVAKSSAANPHQPLHNGSFFNGGSGSTLPDCPGSPSLNKPPPFFSRLFRFSTRDKNRKAGANLPPSVAHVDVIRKGDPESPQDEPDSVFSAENLSQWPSVQSDIVTSFVEPTNDAATTSFMSQWASVPMDMTSSRACHNSEWSSSQDNCGGNGGSGLAEPEVDNNNDDDDDQEDPDVVVIRRSSTFPSFRSRAGYSSSEQINAAPNGSHHDDEEHEHVDVFNGQKEREEEPAPRFNIGTDSLGEPIVKETEELPCFVDPGAKKKRSRRAIAELPRSDELKFVLLNGTFPPKHNERPVSASKEASATLPGQMLESPCSEDSAVFDLSPVNPLAKIADPRPAERKYKVDSAIFDSKPAAATLPIAPANSPIGPVIDLEDPKATRRRFEAQLPSSCRPASVSPVRDPAVIRRVKKMSSAIRPISYTAGIGPMQRASTDLHQMVLSKSRFSQKQQPSMLERSCSVEALGLEIGGEDKPVEETDSSAKPTCQDALETSRGSELSDEVDSGTFVRKKPSPLQRSGTFTKEDKKLSETESSATETRQISEGTASEVERATDVVGTREEGSECKETNGPQPPRSVSPQSSGRTFSRHNGGGSAQRGELRKPSELKVSRITKESQEISSSESVVPVIHKELKTPDTESQMTAGSVSDRTKQETRKNCKLHIPLPVVNCAPPKTCSKVPTSLNPTRGTPRSSSRKKFVHREERSFDSSPTTPETPDHDQLKLVRPITPQKSRLQAPSKIGKPSGAKKASGLKNVAKSSVTTNSTAAAVHSPSFIEDSRGHNSPATQAKSDSETCLVESVTRVAEEAQEKIRFVMRQTVSSNARRKKSADIKDLSSEKPDGNKVGNGSEVVKKATNKITHSAPKAPEDGVDERTERQSSKVDFEVEIARLGEVCEARSAELDTLRKQLQDSTVAHGALAFAAHYWSERLRKTEEYSARLKRQLQLAGKVISNAHNNIENLETKLQQEVATHKDEIQKFEEAKQQKITELEAKQISTVEELRTEHERKIDELKSSLATASEDTVHKSKLIELQEEHERALEALRESKEAEFNALRGTQRDLERRLDEKNQQFRRVEEEAAALKAKLLQSADARAQWLNEKINSLEKEVESLNAVLEMKVAENRELLAEKRENQDRKERMALMQEALDKQRAKIEDLTAQLDIKAETQQKLKSENAKLLQLSESKDRIISKMGRNFEELKYKMQDGSSFTVDVSTPVHRPLRETKSFGAPSNGAEVEDTLSRSWHLSLREKSQKKSNHSRSASSDSKNSEDEIRPHVLDDVFTQEERTALEETVSTPVAAASRA